MSVEELIVNPNQSLEGRYGGTKGFSYVANLEEEAQMPTLKGSLILEGGSEAYPQQITGIKLYNEDGYLRYRTYQSYDFKETISKQKSSFSPTFR